MAYSLSQYRSFSYNDKIALAKTLQRGEGDPNDYMHLLRDRSSSVITTALESLNSLAHSNPEVISKAIISNPEIVTAITDIGQERRELARGKLPYALISLIWASTPTQSAAYQPEDVMEHVSQQDLHRFADLLIENVMMRYKLSDARLLVELAYYIDDKNYHIRIEDAFVNVMRTEVRDPDAVLVAASSLMQLCGLLEEHEYNRVIELIIDAARKDHSGMWKHNEVYGRENPDEALIAQYNTPEDLDAYVRMMLCETLGKLYNDPVGVGYRIRIMDTITDLQKLYPKDSYFVDSMNEVVARTVIYDPLSGKVQILQALGKVYLTETELIELMLNPRFSREKAPEIFVELGVKLRDAQERRRIINDLRDKGTE